MKGSERWRRPRGKLQRPAGTLVWDPCSARERQVRAHKGGRSSRPAGRRTRHSPPGSPGRAPLPDGEESLGEPLGARAPVAPGGGVGSAGVRRLLLPPPGGRVGGRRTPPTPPRGRGEAPPWGAELLPLPPRPGLWPLLKPAEPRAAPHSPLASASLSRDGLGTELCLQVQVLRDLVLHPATTAATHHCDARQGQLHLLAAPRTPGAGA